MTDTQVQDHRALRLSQETAARTASGYVMLLVLLLDIILGFLALGLMADESTLGWGLFAEIGAGLGFLLMIKGVYLRQPNQAAAILLFGSYKGTDRTTGLRWV